MSTDVEWKGLYKAGSTALLVSGVLFIVNVILLVSSGPPPTNGEAFLRTLSNNRLVWQAVQGIFTLVSILLVFGTLALYMSLRQVNNHRMLLATGLAGTGIVLGLVNSVMGLAVVGLPSLTAATADLALAFNNTATVVTILIFSVATIVTSSVMLKGKFGKGVAYLGFITGIIGLIGGILSGTPIFAASIILFAIWFLAVGAKLPRVV